MESKRNNQKNSGFKNVNFPLFTCYFNSTELKTFNILSAWYLLGKLNLLQTTILTKQHNFIIQILSTIGIFIHSRERTVDLSPLIPSAVQNPVLQSYFCALRF
jgi:hypothetical protein